MVTFQAIFYFVLTITISILPTSISLGLEEKNVRFSVDLIHRDSPKSPFYNYSLTHSQRVTGAIRRSVNSHHHRLKSASTDIIPNNGEFLMKISIGTPPVEMLAIADTGSDLTWIQCKPCTHCLKQNSPLFSPHKSSSYETVPCSSGRCHSLSEGFTCDATKNSCQYSTYYGDKSFSYGDVATETLALGTRVNFTKITFGCGHQNGGTLDPEGTGIVGLGGGPLSLISQLGPKFGGKFSYCLVGYESEKSSKIYFGESDAFSNKKVVSTPLVQKHPSTYYFVTLERVTVGHKKIHMFNSSSVYASTEEGNMVVDSGTTLTFLPLDLYDKVESAVKNYVKLTSVKDPQGALSLCYKPVRKLRLPRITLHFKDAKLKLKTSNAFVRISDDTFCFAFAPARIIPILGNLAQMNLFVGYDLKKKTVSFRPTNCEKV